MKAFINLSENRSIDSSHGCESASVVDPPLMLASFVIAGLSSEENNEGQQRTVFLNKVCYFQLLCSVLKEFSSLKFVSSIVFYCVIIVLYANCNSIVSFESFVSFVSLKSTAELFKYLMYCNILYKFEIVCWKISCDPNVKQVTLQRAVINVSHCLVIRFQVM